MTKKKTEVLAKLSEQDLLELEKLELETSGTIGTESEIGDFSSAEDSDEEKSEKAAEEQDELTTLEAEFANKRRELETLERRILLRREAEKQRKLNEISRFMALEHIEFKELAKHFGYEMVDASAPTTAPKKAPAPPKFKNPTTGETHSGRGQLPAWLKEARDAGKLEEFRIK